MTNSALAARLDAAVAGGRLVIPVVDSLANYSSLVPPVLARLNGWEWSGSSASTRLARKLLEELGIEDRRRRVFISHKRDDGLAAAEQLHDFLSHYGFEPFIDRFGVGFGRDVQDEIADALEDVPAASRDALGARFRLGLRRGRLRTDPPDGHAHRDLARRHYGTPGNEPLAASGARVPRFEVRQGLRCLHGCGTREVLEEVEAIHAKALVSRRRYLLRSAEDAAHAARLECTPRQVGASWWKGLKGRASCRSQPGCRQSKICTVSTRRGQRPRAWRDARCTGALSTDSPRQTTRDARLGDGRKRSNSAPGECSRRVLDVMALRFESMRQSEVLAGRAVFLSASIPDQSRWHGEFDVREITDAVVAASRAVLTADGVLVTAAHPTIAPLLLYVAGEFSKTA